jgi:putative aldouronate transport system substrate-binding protein
MNKKLVYPALLAAALTIGAVGCSNGKPAQQPGGGSAADAPAANANKKFSISAMKYVYGDVPPADGRGIKMINEKFNVDYTVNLVPQGTYDEKLQAVLASGKIPDMLLFQSPDLTNRYNKFAKQGAFLPLDDYIKQYPSFQRIPQYVLDQFKVNGKNYAIPGYYPKFGFTVILRKDWLDSLNLKVPTNYDELKQVALAFTKNDPDKNGKNDTYGLAIGKDINYSIPMGAYWDMDAWYHKDSQGRFIPGIISPARKDMIQWFADLYKEGAMTRDFATLDWGATNKEFYSGKAGIFIGTPRGMSQQYMEGLLQIAPNAQFVHLEPFKAPDGSQGFNAARGFLGMTAISAEAGKDPAKVKRMLEMLDFGRKFYPNDQKNDKNKDFDWLLGNLNEGYELKDGIGVPKTTAGPQGLAPSVYLPDTAGWPVKDSDIDYPRNYSLPKLVQLTENIAKTYAGLKFYQSPNYPVVSETEIAKGTELKQYLLDEQTKMIAGQRPISDWDKMVDEWKAKGGEQIIKEINAGIKIKDPKEAWE